MTLVHLGALAAKELPQEAREALDDIDVLFVPIGGDGVLSPSDAHELAVSLEPHIIVPIHWSGMGAAKSLESFLKEEGGSPEKVDKLTLKKKDALARDSDIIVITP
jgi:L-ascorbate metabolism protein UlaG (beta-lactamase superfamily)